MRRIGLLSDTHSFIHERIYTFFENVDEIWHAGDFGNIETADKLAEFKPLKGVYGNIDGQDVRIVHPLHQRFNCEDVDVWMTHIGGYPGRYERYVKPDIYNNSPDLFISGHSHILKVIYDKKLNFLHINPGAAGIHGFHKVCTALRFVIDGKNIRDLEIWEIPRYEIVPKKRKLEFTIFLILYVILAAERKFCLIHMDVPIIKLQTKFGIMHSLI